MATAMAMAVAKGVAKDILYFNAKQGDLAAAVIFLFIGIFLPWFTAVCQSTPLGLVFHSGKRRQGLNDALVMPLVSTDHHPYLLEEVVDYFQMTEVYQAVLGGWGWGILFQPFWSEM